MTATERLTPGAQANVYRNGMGTEFARSVLHELISYAGKLETDTDAIWSMLSFTRDGRNDLMAFEQYDNRIALAKTAEQVVTLFDSRALAHVNALGLDVATYRVSAVAGAEATRHITALFPDLTCNHGVVGALESVITWLFVTQGQDRAANYVRAATLHGMVLFTESNAKRRRELPQDVQVSLGIF